MLSGVLYFIKAFFLRKLRTATFLVALSLPIFNFSSFVAFCELFALFVSGLVICQEQVYDCNCMQSNSGALFN